MKSDIEIANEFQMKPIADVAKMLKLDEEQVEFYGRYKAKINVSGNSNCKRGKLILVTAINPTSAGEGKTTVSIGLADAMKIVGANVCLALREPSLGPVFGVKGGAAGGGYSQVVPMEDINLHFNGDLHAITSANNLLSSMIDNHLQQGNSLNINPKTIAHKRCLDLNDRALRNIVVGLGKPTDGVTREEHFDITAASEVMAILCLSQNLEDLKQRLGNIIVGYTFEKKPILARQLGASDAMAILLRDAIKPNLVQTLGGVPAIVHGGPFANIAHGCNSIIATKTALSLSDYTVTEAGFGADLGAEKFLDVKCRIGGFCPDAVVIVATVRALKMHGGSKKEELSKENIQALKSGIANLAKHVSNIKEGFKLNVVVAINKFASDTEKEIKLLVSECDKMGVKAVPCNVWGEGGNGAIELAKTVMNVCDKKIKGINFMYDLTDSVEDKIDKIASMIYGAKNVIFSDTAMASIKTLKDNGYANLPILIAKTQYSLSDNPSLMGRPTNFEITIRDVMVKAGAGFIVAVAGDIMLMPGLPKEPAAEKMTIDAAGVVKGLF